MLAIGADELGKGIRRAARCPNCHKYHKVQYGDKVQSDRTLTPSKLLAFVKCTNGSLYLVGIDEKGLKR